MLAYLCVSQSLGEILYLSFHSTRPVADEAPFKAMTSTVIILNFRGMNSENPGNPNIYFQLSKQKQLQSKVTKLKGTVVFKVTIYWELTM